MTVVLGEYFSSNAILSHSNGTTKLLAVMTMEGKYCNSSPVKSDLFVD